MAKEHEQNDTIVDIAQETFDNKPIPLASVYRVRDYDPIPRTRSTALNQNIGLVWPSSFTSTVFLVALNSTNH
jgi:hypothetical protein